MKYFIYLLVILISFLKSNNTIAQIPDSESYTSEIDSLQTLLRGETSFRDKSMQFLYMWQRVQAKTKDKGASFSREAISTIEKLGLDEWKGYGLMYLAYSYKGLGKYDSCEKFYHQTVIAFTSSKDTVGLINAHKGWAYVLILTGKVTEAMHHSITSMHLSEKTKKYRGVAINAMDIANALDNQRKFSEALKYYKIALKYSLVDSNTSMIPNSLIGIGNIYAQIHQDDSAHHYYYRALSYSNQYGENAPKGIVLNCIGDYYNNRQLPDSALKYYMQSIPFLQASSNLQGIVSSEIGIARVLSEFGDYDSSISRLQSALVIAAEKGFKTWLKEIYYKMSYNYEKLGDLKKSLEFQKLYTGIKDSLYNEENSQIVSDLQIQYETEKKEQTILLLQKDSSLHRSLIDQKSLELREQIAQVQLLDQENKIKELQIERQKDSITRAVLKSQADSAKYESANQDRINSELKLRNVQVQFGLAGILGIVSFFLIGVILNARYKAKRRKLREAISDDFHDELGEIFTHISGDVDLINDRLTIKDPIVAEAFNNIRNNTMNAFTSFRDLIWGTNPNADRISGFINLFREVLSRFEKSSRIAILPELQSIRQNFRIKPDIAIEVMKAVRIALNNAVKHSHATLITVVLKIVGRKFHIEIIDNGIGFNLSEKQNTGKGLNNLQTRMDGIDGTYEIITSPGNGTRVILDGSFT